MAARRTDGGHRRAGGRDALDLAGLTSTDGSVRLVPATPELIDAELHDPHRLAADLDVALPDDWPPEHNDADTLRFFRDALSDPDAAGWWSHYVVVEDERPVLTGVVGYKGPPTDGVVEIGYSVVPSWQRRGIATQACGLLIERAWRHGAHTVVAHTLPELEPSMGVLRKLGFSPVASTEPDVLAFELRR